MKRGTFSHPKTKRLAQLLGVDQATAYGIVAALCNELAPEYAPRGDVGKLSDEEIALGLGSTIEPTKLVQALRDSRWLCPADEIRLVIHDFADHAEESVRKKLQRGSLSFVLCECRAMSRHVETMSADVRQCSAPAREAVVLGSGSGSEGGCRGDSAIAVRTGGITILPEAIPDTYEPSSEVLEAWAKEGCTDPPRCIRQRVLNYRAKRNDPRARVNDWHGKLIADAMNHQRFGGPCQVKPGAPAADQPVPAAIQRALERRRGGRASA